MSGARKKGIARRPGIPLNTGVLLVLTSRLFGFLFLLAAGGEVFKAKCGGTEERNH
ncbi:hypothetical protein IZT72_18520 [Pseudomonas brenneri]|jgi:hypothetical protein|uniref:hypothetical protein n=1 Tax=Pseudomonas brenneri TaxID=129817 RepID=UPI0018A29234|nr:hypothetical protein [Pseudomonas brenneri]MBF8006603.1 hypothetical protein [Pseudomonas brenneri]WJM93182.1 hypothetical protein QDY63_09915 [Pseudomonas brenneri]